MVSGVTGKNPSLWQPITRTQFETLTATETQRIESCLLDTLKRPGLAIEQIDAVARTGVDAPGSFATKAGEPGAFAL
jgi:hypothetical protein